MGCIKSLNLNLEAGGQVPFNDAVYVPALDKILAVSGVYAYKCNATTGAVESRLKVAAPGIGPSRIAYYTGHGTSMVYVALWIDPSWVDMATVLETPRMEIYGINPTTFAAAVGIGIQANIPVLGIGMSSHGLNGIQALTSYGDYLYFAFRYQQGGGQYFRIDPTNPPDNAPPQINSIDWDSYNVSGIAVDGTYLYYPVPLGGYAKRISSSLPGAPAVPDAVSLDTQPETPVAVELANGYLYGVCGNGDLFKILNWGTGNYVTGEPTAAHYNAQFNLETIQASAKAFRLRTNPYDGKLYIPIQNQDCVIVWNPLTDTQYAGMLKTGFDGPIDVVFTPTKSFAVQSGQAGLKEIT